MDNWVFVSGFPGYSVSDAGEVRNDRRRAVLTPTYSRRGSYVGMYKEGVQRNRMLSRLVAEAFLPAPELSTFDTPIHLDGDLDNNHVSNLMWRPRWFAVHYHRQFVRSWDKGMRLRDVETNREFDSVLHVCKTFGLLGFEVFDEALNHGFYANHHYDRGVWPTNQHFQAI